MKASVKSRVIGSLLSVVIILVLYWFMLPPINPTSPAFWIFIIISLAVFLAVLGFGELHALVPSSKVVNIGGNKVTMPGVPSMPKSKLLKGFVLAIGAVIVFMILATVFGAEIFHASTYKQLIDKQEGNFAEEVAQIDMDQIPVVDKDTASQLGRRKLGEMSDLVSQFEIADNYTQINMNGRPVRVTPLMYGDIFKWLNNQSKGVPAYIKVDMVTQDATLVRLEQGIKYAPYEYLMRDLQRHLRFQYPTKIFDSFSFEVDEAGTPYWIAPTVRYRVGLWNGQDMEGAVLVNAITGESQYYDLADIPTWVDQVYRADIILEQLNWNGKYQTGFWNSVFGQIGVLRTTQGYNYIAINDDVYLYTGMTSVASDQSNVGFVLVNMRTKDTRFYTVSGAEEMSAMTSAQGRVQDQGYTSTFPILLNIADRPTYFMSLKDNSGLVKMYAFVDVNRYQLVGLGSSVKEAREDYIALLAKEEGVETEKAQERSGVIAEIYAAVLDGNTRYYFRFEEDPDSIYAAPIQVSAELPFLKAGDAVKVTYTGTASPYEVSAIAKQA